MIKIIQIYNQIKTFLGKDLSQKVDKVEGKGLSTNDFTNELKQQLANINTLIQSDNTALDTLQEIVDFVTTNKATLDTLGISNIAGLQNALNQKAGANHTHTKAQVGLNRVDNTRDVDKVISNAVKQELKKYMTFDSFGLKNNGTIAAYSGDLNLLDNTGKRNDEYPK